MTIIQILLVLFALYAIGRTFFQFRSGHVGKGGVVFWTLFWLLVGVVALMPQTTDIVARFVGVGRGADLAIYLSLIALFFLIFRIFVKLEHVEREITTVVRKLALKEEEDQKPKV